MTASLHPAQRSRQDITVVDISAGAGGLACGLAEAGFRPVLLLESDPDARATITANTPWHVEPFHDFDPSEFMGSENVSLIAGNLSSAGISVAGPRQESGEEQYARALERIEAVRPRAVLLLNVAGLMAQRFQGLRLDLDQRLADLGYQVAWRVIDSASFGLPQSRRRAALVAFRQGQFTRFVWPAGGVEVPTVGEFLRSHMSSEGWPGAAQWSRLAAGIAPTIVGGSKRHGGADLGPTRTKAIWYSLGVDPRGIANGPPGPDTPVRAMPRLTTEMLAALQGFPPDWRFVGKKTSIYRQIASAFPPHTAAVLGAEIAAALKSS